ncbi:cytochrome c oxidase assembly protein [Leucobacter chromiiresistens]|uniref:Putative membrane protein n=1 Tax=Leucobacter chromiiresistens TaxID=1079994 RepID=A0A1H0XYB8_9MICO|nr:cytochrome c oxidase assembly protein [Leucobacter chromiiresistens]SDQ07883.1 putative membrane protein [Leucobacter chromiiresistens]
MTPAHVHGGEASAPGAELILAVPALAAVTVYVAAAVIETRRGRPWPWHRTACWIAGALCAAAGFVGPLAAASHGSFVAHMGAHLLVGMVAPLLLVLAAPITLALRALSVDPARRLSRVLRSPVARVLAHPVVAAVLNVGGMWVLYRTPLYDAMQRDLLVHWLVMLHFIFAGTLYTAALVGVDPSPHRSGFALRAGVLVVSLAAHGVLAKLLVAEPPPGISAAEAEAGAQLMFYGGDAVDFVLIVLLCAEWYRVTGRRMRRETAGRAAPAPPIRPADATRRPRGASV